MIRQFIILFIFFAFTFSTIDELVKLCFDKIESVQELTDKADFEKDIDLDKIFHNTNHSLFQAIFFAPKLSLNSNHFHNCYIQLIYTIVSPPPEF